MESLSNAANAASRAIWGEQSGDNPTAKDTDSNSPMASGTEPMSGVQGGEGEPYDGGNIESKGTGADTSTRDVGSTDTETKPSGGIAQGGVPQGSNVTGDISRRTDDRPTESNKPSGGVVEPSVSADPTTGTQPRQKQHGADRPSEQPGDEGVDAIKDKKDKAEATASGDSDPSGDSGPLGSSGPSDGPSTDTGSGSAGSLPTGGAGGAPGAPSGAKLDNESHGEGTGTKYVKSTGMAAEGGDFDATRPGAGREADRLLEEKGIHHGEDKKGDDDTPSGTSDPSGGSKPSLKEKIKDKLHRH